MECEARGMENFVLTEKVRDSIISPSLKIRDGENRMALFRGDNSFWLVNSINPPMAALIGAVVGYFLSNTVVLTISGIIVFLIVLAAIDSRGKGICALFNYGAIVRLAIILVVMWVATLTVNHWWPSLLPKGILR